jgi:zinc/manganese transport system substrate-binding protein
MRIILTASATTAAVVALAGCGGSSAASKPSVVAAENVYGNIVEQIAGGRVAVTSILHDPNADPHLYEPGTANGLAVAHAKLVIENGLGYDAFVDKLQAAAPSSQRATVTIANVLGIRGRDANPHLWYDVAALPKIARAIERALARAFPEQATAFRKGLQRFDASLKPLDAEIATIRRAHAGEPVAYTEPVPGYLIAAAGLKNLAPDSFTRAIEDGAEPAPVSVADMLELVRGRHVRVLLYNTQAVSPITVRVRQAARAAGVPVVGVSETLPRGLTVQRWQLAEARALGAALRR